MAITDPRMKGMKKDQIAVLHELCQHDVTTLRKIAEVLGRDTNGISQAWKALDRRGLVEWYHAAPETESRLDRLIRFVPQDTTQYDLF